MEHVPHVSPINVQELLDFCEDSGYKCRLEPRGTLLLPPDYNIGMTDWERSLRLRCARADRMSGHPLPACLASSDCRHGRVHCKHGSIVGHCHVAYLSKTACSVHMRPVKSASTVCEAVQAYAHSHIFRPLLPGTARLDTSSHWLALRGLLACCREGNYTVLDDEPETQPGDHPAAVEAGMQAAGEQEHGPPQLHNNAGVGPATDIEDWRARLERQFS